QLTAWSAKPLKITARLRENEERSKALSLTDSIYCIVTNNEKKNSQLFPHLYYLIFKPSLNKH
ncbi:hypothetical protein, partial [Acinetobacter baumannii]|uniref:hypothetical protein n=1 Tax=Acinetobacter baumannii TaxID=470 RepID=UPI001BB46328